MAADLLKSIENLVKKAPSIWFLSACKGLRILPALATVEQVRQHMPVTNNADLSFLMNEVVCLASAQMSWETLSWILESTYTAYHLWQTEQRVELLWAGPTPPDQVPARRIDQALYDLVTNAKREILLVTFAATKIEKLSGELLKATQRGVHIRLILEFEESSEGQLSFDALKAFPEELVTTTEVYHWPVDKRERNKAGRPGKLHAKLAIIDETVLVSSANLTDDAFNRNLELGVMVSNAEFLMSAKNHLTALISNGTLKLVGH